MKNIRIFIRKLSAFGGEIFNIFELACFHNEGTFSHDAAHIIRYTW